MTNYLRILLLGLLLLLLVAFPAMGQDATPKATGPSAGDWALELGAPGVLLLVLLKLWSYFQKKDDDHVKEQKARDEKEKKQIEAHEKEKAALKVDHEKEKTELVKVHEADKDKLRSSQKDEKRAMREAFEEEKSEMREIYTQEISSMRDRMETEQRERREETEKLWKQNNDTTREVLTVVKDMIASMETNSRAVTGLTTELRRGAGGSGEGPVGP
jgi:hypothetical protein